MRNTLLYGLVLLGLAVGGCTSEPTEARRRDPEEMVLAELAAGMMPTFGQLELAEKFVDSILVDMPYIRRELPGLRGPISLYESGLPEGTFLTHLTNALVRSSKFTVNRPPYDLVLKGGITVRQNDDGRTYLAELTAFSRATGELVWGDRHEIRYAFSSIQE